MAKTHLEDSAAVGGVEDRVRVSSEGRPAQDNDAARC